MVSPGDYSLMLQYMCMHLQQPRVHALQQWLEWARYFLTLSKPPLAIWGLTVFVLHQDGQQRQQQDRQAAALVVLLRQHRRLLSLVGVRAAHAHLCAAHTHGRCSHAAEQIQAVAPAA